MSRARFVGPGIAVLVALSLTFACAPPALEGGFNSPTPAARLYAVEYAAERGDRCAIKDIIELLDSDDPAVRLLAIGALERLTGRSYGYDHADPPMDRASAIRRWVAAYESGELHPDSPAPAIPVKENPTNG